jgi:CRISPR/Cas system-associated exonuclease Cas4 (RecB family)
MQVADIIVIAIIALMAIIATTYIIREKKKGKKCIGCPYADSCQKRSCGKAED